MPAFYFHDGNGQLRQGPESVFPILTMLDFGTPDQRYQYVATASFIHPRGVFATAKHTLLDNQDRPLTPAIAIHQYGRFLCVRHLSYFNFHPVHDIAVGELHGYCVNNRKHFGSENLVAAIPIKIDQLPANHYVRSFAYPLTSIGDKVDRFQKATFVGDWSEGHVEEFLPNGRDRTFLPGACYRTSMPVLSGASGGPVFNEDGFMVAVNSTSFGDLPPSHITPVVGMLDLVLNGDVRITVGDLLGYGKS